MPVRPLLFLARPLTVLGAVLAVVACGSDPIPPPADAGPDSSRAVTAPPTPFDVAPADVDSVEPPEQIVEIPSRPPPTPPPDPPLVRPPNPPPTPVPPPASGSCDVREAQGYCFVFTGEGWSPESARARCGEAPEATFDGGVCPVANRIATCAYAPPSTPDREIVYTYYAPYDLALAELACPGTFTRLD